MWYLPGYLVCCWLVRLGLLMLCGMNFKAAVLIMKSMS